MLLFLLIFETWSVEHFITVGIAAIAAFLLARSDFVKQYMSSSKNLLEMRTTEITELKKDVVDLKEENRLLRREINQRMEINLQDQETIRELKRDKNNG